MLVYDLADPQELLGFVRNIPTPQFTLEQYLPNEMLNDVEYRFVRDDTIDQDVAPYRAWDAEAAIGSRQGLSRIMGEIPPISKKIRLGEEQRLRLRSLQLGGDTGAIVDKIFDDAGNMSRAVQARVEQARGRALYDGKFVVNENGFIQTLDYGIPGGQRVAPVTAWSNTGASTPVDDMRTWIDVYVDANGFPPAVALTSTAVISNLLRNAQIRTLAASLSGGPSIVSRPVLNATLSDYELPPLVTYDTSVRVGGSATKVIPNDRVVFLPPAGSGLGRTFWGITAEALELASEGMIVERQAPGLVAVVDKEFDPVSTWTKAASVVLPVIANPKQILTADVQ
jgi:hypothetical protein